MEIIGQIQVSGQPRIQFYLGDVAAYFLPMFFFDLAASANSISCRIASERESLSGCCFAQASIADLSAGERRIADTGSLPVAGRPRFLFGSTLLVDMLSVYW